MIIYWLKDVKNILKRSVEVSEIPTHITLGGLKKGNN